MSSPWGVEDQTQRSRQNAQSGQSAMPPSSSAARPQGSINDISGGHHGTTIMGQHGQLIQKQVNKTYLTGAANSNTGPALIPGSFRISSLISVLENEPICVSSRVFRAVLHSEVTGDKKIIVKITPADNKHLREAKINFLVPHHKNIVERIATDVFNFRGQSSIYIAMECCDCNLHDHIKSQVRDGVEFDPEKHISIARQIVVALEFLHSNKVVHGDLKPSNVLLILNGNVVKLSDFGLSRAISENKTSTQRTSPQGGTMGWQSPEVLKGTTRMSPENDIFPLGLTIYHTLSYGKHPYGDKPYSWNHFIAEGINRNLGGMRIPDADTVKPLLESMLLLNPGDRPTAKQVLEHEFFTAQDSDHASRVDDTQLEELFGRALRAPSQAEASEDFTEQIHFKFTLGQLSNALSAMIRRNRPEVSRIKSEISQAQIPTQPKQLLVETPSTTRPARAETTDSRAPGSASGSHQSQIAVEVAQPKHISRKPYSRRLTSGSESQTASRATRQTHDTLAKSIQGNGSTTAPLCRRHCGLILISPDPNHKQQISKLAVKLQSSSSFGKQFLFLFGFTPMNATFIQCDAGSDPSMIQEQFAKMTDCGDGITMIIVTYRSASITLAKALQERSLKRFLENKGFVGVALSQRLESIRRNLAAFAMQSITSIITQESAKIAVHIWLNVHKIDESGWLITKTAKDGKVYRSITFCDANFSYLDGLPYYIANQEVMTFIKATLCRHDEVKNCTSH